MAELHLGYHGDRSGACLRYLRQAFDNPHGSDAHGGRNSKLSPRLELRFTADLPSSDWGGGSDDSS